MIKVKVKYDLLEDMLQKANQSVQELELPDYACLGDILTLLEIPEYLIALITIDKIPSEKSAALYDGAYVEFFPMFAGG